MRAIHETQAGHHDSAGHSSFISALVNRISQMSETIWLGITFTLFIAMGPFSVIAVLYGLWALATGENKGKMVEPASF